MVTPNRIEDMINATSLGFLCDDSRKILVMTVDSTCSVLLENVVLAF